MFPETEQETPVGHLTNLTPDANTTFADTVDAVSGPAFATVRGIVMSDPGMIWELPVALVIVPTATDRSAFDSFATNASVCPPKPKRGELGVAGKVNVPSA